MADSLIATFEVDLDALRRLAPLLAPTPRDPPLVIEHGVLAIEVIRFAEADRYAVLLSSADRVDEPTRLRCWLAFGNDVARCDEFRAVGVPMIEAELNLVGSRLDVIANRYPRGALALRWSRLLQIDGVRFAVAARGQARSVTYTQDVPRPDLLHPGFDVVGRATEWRAQRRWRALPTRTLSVRFEPTLFPDFDPLFTDPRGAQRPVALAGGSMPDAIVPGTLAPPRAMNKAGTVGAPHYRFEAMELIGFRIPLPPPPDDGPDPLAALVGELNFHRNDPQAPNDFEYRVAARSLIVELIRYGRMKYADASGPLSADTYMSQHELLVRVLVGRVDEDSAQARDASTFVQAIFVDNPTSKAVGREMQGYPKLLGSFCSRAHDGRLAPLRQDGSQGDAALPLTSIRAISRTTHLPPVSADALEANTVLEFDYSIPAVDDDALIAIDTDAITAIGTLAGTPWRENDFADPAFARAFARRVLRDGLSRSRSVQVIPVDVDAAESQTWLTGTFTLTDIRFAQPPGIATLTFHPGRGGRNWQRLGALLATIPGAAPPGSDAVSVSLTRGDWYRVRCNMDLTIDDGLAWE